MPKTLTQEQYKRIAHLLPVQRGKVRIANVQLLNAVLYVVENGCKWRALPEPFGKWHTVYTRLRRWQRSGVLRRVFAALQEQQLLAVRLEVLGLDSTSVKVHPDGSGALKKTVPRRGGARGADVPPRFIWLPQMSARP
jgi:transposase